MKLETHPEALHQLEAESNGKRVWAEDQKTDSLIVFPISSISNFHQQFKKHHLRILDHSPSVIELGNHKGGVIIMESNPGTGDPITTRAYWEAQNGAHALGALFPTLKPEIKEHETLIGLLFPEETKYDGQQSVEVIDPWLNVLADSRAWMVTHVLSPNEQQSTLDKILAPKKGPISLAIYGLGDIGSFVAQNIYSAGVENSGVRELLLISGNINTSLALEAELRDIKRLDQTYPTVGAIHQEDTRDIQNADVILFLASGYIPPADADSLRVDVRTVQHGINAQIVRDLVRQMHDYGEEITLLMASDPVEQLTWYAAEQARNGQRNNQNFAGFGAAINFARALNQAESMNIDPHQVEVFNVHGKGMVAYIFDKLANLNIAERLSLTTALRNYVIRGFNKKPWRAPAQMMTDALIGMLTDGSTFASPFLPSVNGKNPGAFFGTKVIHDVGRGTWKPALNRKYDDQLRDILDRAQQINNLTSARPDLLHTDILAGSMDPATAVHPAFHEDAFRSWYVKADKFARDMNGPYYELAEFSNAVVTDMLQAIDKDESVALAEAKNALRERIGITIKKKEGLLNEKVRLLTEGFLGGELLAGVEYSNLVTVADMIYRLLRIKEKPVINQMVDVFTKREPAFESLKPDEAIKRVPIAVRTESGETLILDSIKKFDDYLESINKVKEMDEIPLDEENLIEKFPLEALKHPHIQIRENAWWFIANRIYDHEISPEIFKKILTLTHFGDDLTLYQWTGIPHQDRILIEDYLYSQINVLDRMSKKIDQKRIHNTDNTIILGSTGAPVGQHHLDVLKSGMEALKLRYPRQKTEAFISVDNFSRTKAKQILSGEIPNLALRRRVAMLQAVNEVNTHLLFPAIPIWFDSENIHLKEQIQRETPSKTKIFRLIGGDQLLNYPQTTVYQSLAHVIDMRAQDRQVMDSQLNRLNLKEVIQIDSQNEGSSTDIRERLKSGESHESLNPLTRSFMKHYGIYS